MNNEYTIYNLRYVTGPLLPLRDLAATSSGYKTTAIMLLVLSRIDRLQRGRGYARGH